jgi:CRP-like cAMP-binding protein
MEVPQRSNDSSLLHGPEALAEVAASDDARIRHLEGVPLFAGFRKEQLRRLAGISTIREAKAGMVLTQLGGPGDSFFVIIDGMVAVHTPAGAGDELRPCDFFGEMSLLDGEPRSATVTAITDVRLLAVDRSNFWRLLDETPELTRQILMVLSRRVRRLEQTANALLRGTV